MMGAFKNPAVGEEKPALFTKKMINSVEFLEIEIHL
jgi:hypothetical protein